MRVNHYPDNIYNFGRLFAFNKLSQQKQFLLRDGFSTSSHSHSLTTLEGHLAWIIWASRIMMTSHAPLPTVWGTQICKKAVSLSTNPSSQLSHVHLPLDGIMYVASLLSILPIYQHCPYMATMWLPKVTVFIFKIYSRKAQWLRSRASDSRLRERRFLGKLFHSKLLQFTQL